MPTGNVVELRERLLELGERSRELREKPAEERSANWAADIKNTAAEITALDAELRVAQMLDNAPGPQAGTQQVSYEHRSPGTLLIEHPDFQEWCKRGARGSSPAIEVERRNLVSTVVSGDGGALLPHGQPFLAPGAVSRRRLFVRDLIAPGSTTLSSVPYVRELNPRANELGASAVAEASAKPEVTMQFEPDDAPVRTVAAWIPITMQAMEDMPTMRSYIDGRLTYMVYLREEEEMLNGPGTGARLKGIRSATGLQTQAALSDKAQTIGMAISKIELVDGEPDGVAMNPLNFWEMLTTRFASQFDGGGANTGAPWDGVPSTVWGLPVVRSRTVPAGKAVVGNWRMGAQVFDRSTVSIRVTDSHEDRFVKNQLVILAESRLALAIHRPDFFVEVTLP
jgi:HK97 family phage major capsid protein